MEDLVDLRSRKLSWLTIRNQYSYATVYAVLGIIQIVKLPDFLLRLLPRLYGMVYHIGRCPYNQKCFQILEMLMFFNWMKLPGQG